MRALLRCAEPHVLTALLEIEPDRRWDSSGAGAVHTAIRDALRVCQGGSCAYCETELREGGHIEHIHPRSADPCQHRPSRNPHYDWGNLLVVCDGQDHCDGPAGKADQHLCGQALFPDEMQSGILYVSVDTGDGAIHAHPGLDYQDRQRVSLSIEKLRLNHPRLRQSRLELVRLMSELVVECGDDSVARYEALCRSCFPSTVYSFFAR